MKKIPKVLNTLPNILPNILPKILTQVVQHSNLVDEPAPQSPAIKGDISYFHKPLSDPRNKLLSPNYAYLSPNLISKLNKRNRVAKIKFILQHWFCTSKSIGDKQIRLELIIEL